MREWHDWYAAVNEKWGLERGDDIHETGARHKSLEEHNRELHLENKSLEEELETKRRAVKGLTTMIDVHRINLRILIQYSWKQWD